MTAAVSGFSELMTCSIKEFETNALKGMYSFHIIDAAPIHLSISCSTLPIFVKKTPKYLNYTIWGSDLSWTQTGYVNLFRLRIMVLALDVLSFPPLHIGEQCTASVQVGAHHSMKPTETLQKAKIKS